MVCTRLLPRGYPTARRSKAFTQDFFLPSSTRLAHAVLHWPKSDWDIWTGRATTTDFCLKLFTNCICAIVITALLYDRVQRSFRKSEVGSRKSLLGFRRNKIEWWFDPSRSYLILEQSKAVIPLTVKLNCNQGHYSQFCVCFECFFFSMGLWYFN